MSGKGDTRRPGDAKMYAENYDRIFGKEKQCPKMETFDGNAETEPRSKAPRRGRRKSKASG